MRQIKLASQKEKKKKREGKGMKEAKARDKDELVVEGKATSETGYVYGGWMAVNDFMETHLMRLSDYFRVGTGAPSQFIIPTQ